MTIAIQRLNGSAALISEHYRVAPVLPTVAEVVNADFDKQNW